MLAKNTIGVRFVSGVTEMPNAKCGARSGVLITVPLFSVGVSGRSHFGLCRQLREQESNSARNLNDTPA